MDLEVAIMPAKGGAAESLINAMNEKGAAALRSCRGCLSVKYYPGVENPGSVLFLIEWDSVDAHNAAKDEDGFKAFIDAILPYFGEGASMQHFRMD